MTIKTTNKLTKAIVIFGILVIATCIMIYLFSAQDSAKSSLTSGKISGLVSKLLFPELDTMPPNVRDEIMTDVSHRIRKCAHFTEYLLLAQFTFQLLLALPRPRTDIVCAIGSLIFSAVFAMTDEYHQSFVPGRAMAAKDVMIDSSGAILGLALVLFVRHSLRKRKRMVAAESVVFGTAETDNISDSETDDISDIETDDISDFESDDTSDFESDDIPDIETDDIPDIETDDISDFESDDIPDIETDDISDFETDDISDIETDDISDIESDDISDIETDDISDIETDDIADIDKDDTTENTDI
jgi:VanZ family protein